MAEDATMATTRALRPSRRAGSTNAIRRTKLSPRPTRAARPADAADGDDRHREDQSQPQQRAAALEVGEVVVHLSTPIVGPAQHHRVALVQPGLARTLEELEVDGVALLRTLGQAHGGHPAVARRARRPALARHRPVDLDSAVDQAGRRAEAGGPMDCVAVGPEHDQAHDGGEEQGEDCRQQHPVDRELADHGRSLPADAPEREGKWYSDQLASTLRLRLGLAQWCSRSPQSSAWRWPSASSSEPAGATTTMVTKPPPAVG